MGNKERFFVSSHVWLFLSVSPGSKAMDYSNGLFDCQSPTSPLLGGLRVLHLLEDLRGALELMDNEERDNLRCQIPDSTAEGLAEWLHGRLVKSPSYVCRMLGTKHIYLWQFNAFASVKGIVKCGGCYIFISCLLLWFVVSSRGVRKYTRVLRNFLLWYCVDSQHCRFSINSLHSKICGFGSAVL